MSRRDFLYTRFPPMPETGIELDPERGYFSVIMPEATTNLVTNPSIETNVTGYTAVAGAIAATYNWQAYGAVGLEVTPAVSTESGFYYGTVSLTSGSTYTASITIQGEAGKTYYIYFATTAGALIGSKRKWKGTGYKQRIWVTYTETSTTMRRVYVTRDTQYADQNKFYADGLQVEAKSYPTTFADGDQKGFVINQVAYLWTGTPHASTSTRSAQTRAGGREMSLLSLGFRILSILGLGMAPLVDQSLLIPGHGELFQGTGTPAREFVLNGAIFGSGYGPRALQSARDDLVDAFKPDLVTTDQTMILRYQACDEDGDPISETLDIVCKYQGGLEQNWDNHLQERMALQFKMHMPMISNQYNSGASLAYAVNVSNANRILKRDTSGNWLALGTGMNDEVRAMAFHPDGSLYVVGNFTTADGVTVNRVAKWNGTTFEALGGTPGASGDVYALVIAPDGTLYIGGDFALAGGVANTVNIAKWDGVNWTPLATGTNGIVEALALDGSGNLYAAGDFTNLGDANGDHVAKWNGAAWSSLGTGTDGTVYNLLFDPVSNSLYAFGTFNNAGGGAASKAAKWNGAAWSALSATAIDANALTSAIVADGSLYIGGAFTNPYAKLMSWNGVQYGNIAGTGSMTGAVLTIFQQKLGPLYIGGQTLTPPTLPTYITSFLIWNGSTWLWADVALPGAETVRSMITDGSGNLYVGWSTAGTAVAAKTTTITNSGSSKANPVFTITGPGHLLMIKNYTTGKAIYIQDTFSAGEKLTLDLNPNHISFSSNIRGNLMSKISPGSNLDFELVPGANDISVFIPESTTAATLVTMALQPAYWSLDGAVIK
jgi:hypothetical protein